MKCLIAPASFKGTFRAREIGEICFESLSQEIEGLDLELSPMADGGSETLELLRPYLGGEKELIRVPGPAGGLLDAGFIYNPSTSTGLIESSKVIGLELLSRKHRNPLIATSYPLGLVVRKLLDLGARTILIGLGDTATLDYGVGMAKALGFRFLDERGDEVPSGGRGTVRIADLDSSGVLPSVYECRFVVLCDVTTPICGEKTVAEIFGPQKGAGESDVAVLERGAESVIRVIEDVTGIDISRMEMGGSAGGIAAVMNALLGAELNRGSTFIAEATGLVERVKRSDLILTGEGRFDEQSFEGKAVSEVISISSSWGKPVSVICAVAELTLMDNAVFRVISGDMLKGRRNTRLSQEDIAQLAVMAVSDYLERKGTSRSHCSG
ncbi:MAG: glycerate kinase [Candidatus Glassbacteria bacterium]